MELTLESALSTGGLVGHLSYLLLVVSMLMRSMTRLRLMVIASSLVAIAYDAIWLKDPVGIFWETMLVGVNVVQLAILWFHSAVGQFTDEEKLLVVDRLDIDEPATRRRLLNCGFWCDEPVGAELTREGETPSHLVFIAEGRVGIWRDGTYVGDCGPGSFVGEMSLFESEGRAAATAFVAEPIRCWKISIDRVHHLRRQNSEIATALDAGLAREMRRKIESGNAARSAETGI